jgi:hypothetical protein
VLLKKASLLKYSGAVDRRETGDDYAEWFAAGMGIDRDHAFMVRRWLPIPKWWEKITSKKRLVILNRLTHVVGHFQASNLKV